MSPSVKDKVPAIPLANISIPSNLQEILASLKNVGATGGGAVAKSAAVVKDDEEYNPLPISGGIVSTEAYKPRPTSPSTRAFLLAQQQNSEEIPFLSSGGGSGDGMNESGGPSKLSNMSDADLMRLVPDGMDLPPPPSVTSKPMYTGGSMPPGLGDGNDEEYDPGQ